MFQYRAIAEFFFSPVVLIGCCLFAMTGCVQRRMTIHTNPEGALVYVDGEEIGTTPASHDFIYYGTREVRLVKSGYETLTVLQPIETPWYQIPPLDFISDNFAFQKIRDERHFSYQMVPTRTVSGDELLQSAENLRAGVQLPLSVTSGTPLMQPEAVPPISPGFVPQQPFQLPSPQRVWPTPSP